MKCGEHVSVGLPDTKFLPKLTICYLLPETNLLNLLVRLKERQKVWPGAIVMKLLTTSAYELSDYARVFVLSKPAQPNLMFRGKAGAYLSEAPGAYLTVEHLKGASLGQAPAFPTKIRQF